MRGPVWKQTFGFPRGTSAASPVRVCSAQIKVPIHHDRNRGKREKAKETRRCRPDVFCNKNLNSSIRCGFRCAVSQSRRCCAHAKLPSFGGGRKRKQDPEIQLLLQTRVPSSSQIPVSPTCCPKKLSGKIAHVPKNCTAT